MGDILVEISLYFIFLALQRFLEHSRRYPGLSPYSVACGSYDESKAYSVRFRNVLYFVDIRQNRGQQRICHASISINTRYGQAFSSVLTTSALLLEIAVTRFKRYESID